MDLLAQIRLDAREILKEGGFEVPVTLESPSSDILVITGLTVVRNELIELDGQDSNARLVSVSIHEQELIDASYPYLNDDDQPKLVGHKVTFTDSKGTPTTYKVDETRWNRTTGIINLKLGDYEPSAPIVYDPFVDTQLGVYWNTTKMVVGSDNLFGDITAGSATSNVKDALGTSGFDLKQSISTSKPFFDGTKVICDGVNDHLLSDSIPSFVASNSDYTMYLIFDWINIAFSQIDFRFIKLFDAGQPLIQLGTVSGLNKVAALSRQTATKFLFTGDSYSSGQKMVVKLDWKAAWSLDVNGTSVTDSPDVRQLPIGMDRMVVGANNSLVSNTPTGFRGGLIYNVLQTDSEKNALVADFITNNF